MKILVTNGPDINTGIIQIQAFADENISKAIEVNLDERANKLVVDLLLFNSDNELELINFIDKNYIGLDANIINLGDLINSGISLYDVLAKTKLPIIEVHLTNLYCKGDYRPASIFAPISK